MRHDQDDRYRSMRLVGSLGSVPLMLGVGPLLGYFFGTWLDKRLGSAPWLQFIFLGLGFAAAVRYIVQTIRRVQKDLDRM